MDGEYPRMVIAAILANRDATTDEQRDAAEVLIWTVEEHPPWGGWCPTCRTQEPCEAQRRADVVALEYLIKKSTELMALNRCKYPHLQPIRTQLKGA
jgi:hypothetical protein